MTPHVPRPFFQTSQVHPTYLPTLHKSGRMEKKLAVAAIAAVGIGYGLSKYKESQIYQQEQQSLSLHEAAQRRKTEAIMDAYGSRASLDDMEAAIKAYETARSK